MVKIPVGMKLWAGGYEPPADWDGGTVLMRGGDELRPFKGMRWNSGEGAGDIIAYTPKPDTIEHAGLSGDYSPAAEPTVIAAGEREEAPWHGQRPEALCEAIAQYWADWEEDRAGTGTYLPEELAEDAGEFANGLYDHLAALNTHAVQGERG